MWHRAHHRSYDLSQLAMSVMRFIRENFNHATPFELKGLGASRYDRGGAFVRKQ